MSKRTRRKGAWRGGKKVEIPEGLGDRIESRVAHADITLAELGRRCEDGQGNYLAGNTVSAIARRVYARATGLAISEIIRNLRLIEVHHGLPHSGYDARFRRTVPTPGDFFRVPAPAEPDPLEQGPDLPRTDNLPQADDDVAKDLTSDQAECVELLRDLDDDTTFIVHGILSRLIERQRLVKAEEEIFDRMMSRRGANGKPKMTPEPV